MAWEGSDRRARLPGDWALRRIRVLRRDAYRCQAKGATGRPCGAPANEVDHIVRGDNHAYENLQAICRECHKKKTQAEAQAARQSRYRKPESHPGLIGD
jgi:5-methylcytosine-specific restriction endonuclease McrA